MFLANALILRKHAVRKAQWVIVPGIALKGAA
jgi:hypothetical protein